MTSLAPPPPTEPPPIGHPSAVAPLRRPVFRWLFIANVISSIGSSMHDVGAGWLMTILAPSAIMVSLVQAAASFPLFVLALPAGALADVADRRRLLLAAQGLMAIIAGALGVSVLIGGGHIHPSVLLLLTLGLGCGSAAATPAWQTAMTDLVPREELPAAAGLNAVAQNVSRAVGPGIGGLLVAAMGPAAAFLFNAISFGVLIVALAGWRYRRPIPATPPESYLGAVRAGLRYIRHSPPLRAVLVRTASFVLFASGLWGLMPLIARQELGLGPSGYGLLYSCLGAGAVLTTFILPSLRRRWSGNTLVVAATMLYAGAMAAIAFWTIPMLACAAMMLAGAAWVTNVTALNVSAQISAPGWVRGRAFSCYLTVFYGGMAAGSAAWGWVATHVSLVGLSGVGTALLLSGVLMVAALASMARYRLSAGEGGVGAEHEYDRHWPRPAMAVGQVPGGAPVAITVEYRIDPSDFEAFALAMDEVRRTRQRDGAHTWMLTQDTSDPTRWVELFLVDSWAEHLRQHDRVTRADRRVQEHARSFHRGAAPPRISHLVATAEEPLR
jgi:MFS family permease